MTKRMIYRSYYIDFVREVEGWRVVNITHAYKCRRLLPPAFVFPDIVYAEKLAKAAIDWQLDGPRKSGAGY